MGILDGIVKWIAEQVMYGLDLINTSVLGALGCDMTTFLRYFPAAETMYNIFVALAIGMILLNLIWQLEPDGRAFAMYSTEQYMEPKREYTTVTTVDGAKWYRQYAQDVVEKKPYQNPDGGISYRESLIRRLPDPPRRKDKT